MTYRPFKDGVDELAPGTKIKWYDDTFKVMRSATIVREHENGWCWWVNEGRGDIMIAYIKIKEIEGAPRNILVSTEEIKEVDMGCNRREGTPVEQWPKTTAITPEMVIAAYVKTRDELAEMKKEFDASIASLKEMQTKRENYLASKLSDLGAESIKSSAGTCFFKTASSATVADGQAFTDWVLADWESRNHFLERRVSKTAVDALVEEGEVPPAGVNYSTVRVVQVRRA